MINLCNRTQQRISDSVSEFQNSPGLSEVAQKEQILPLLDKLENTATIIQTYNEQLKRVVVVVVVVVCLLVVCLFTPSHQSRSWKRNNNSKKC